MAAQDDILGISAHVDETQALDALDKLMARFKELEQELQKLEKARDVTPINSEAFGKLNQRISETRSEMQSIQKEITGTGNELNFFSQQANSAAGSLGKLLGALGGVMALKQLGSAIIKVRSEFQAADIAIQTMLGSKEKADELLGEVRKYAQISPLEFGDITRATQMMLGFNIEAQKVPEYIKAIGDISMGESSKFNSLTLAFSQMSATGKLMGQDLLQMINSGFNPLTVMAEQTGKSVSDLKEEMSKGAISAEMVQEAFIKATSAGGKFYNMSENASKTITGQLSMLQDAMDAAMNKIGQASEGVIISGISGLTTLIENYERVGRVLEGLVVSYGAYRTAVAIATFAQNGHTIAMTLARAQILLTQKAQALLNATMLANPYVLAATALGVLVGGLIACSDGLSAAERGQKDFNDAIAEGEQKQKDYREETEKAIATANDDTAATRDRREAMNLLIARYPSIIKKYIDEKGHLRDILNLKREIAAIDGQRVISGYKEQANKYQRIADIAQKNNEGKPLTTEERKLLREGKDEYFEKHSSAFYNSTMLRDWASEQAKGYSQQATQETKKQNITKFQDDIANRSEGELKQIQLVLAQAKKKGGKVRLGYSALAGAVLSQDDISGLDTYVGGLLQSKNQKVNKKTLKDRKETLQSELDALSTEEAAGKKGLKLRKDIKKIDEKLGLYSSSYEDKQNKDKEKADKKADKAARDAAKKEDEANKSAERITELKNKAQIEQERAAIDMAFSTREAEIKMMPEGTAKIIAQIELEKEKELNAIKRSYEEIKQHRIDEAKQLWEANPNNKGKNFFESDLYKKTNWDALYTAEERRNRETREKAANATAEKAIREQLKVEIQAENDFLKQYGSTQDKKRAIAAEYALKIEEEQDAIRKRAYEAERDKLLSELDLKELQEGMNWEEVFGDLSRQSTAALLELKKKLRQALDVKDITAENAKVLVDKIREIEDTVTSRTDIFASILPGLRKRKELTEQAAAAEMLYQKALEKQASSINRVLDTKKQIQQALKDVDFRNEYGERITIDLAAINEENKEKILASVEKDSDLYNKLLELFKNLAADTAVMNEATEDSTSKARKKATLNDAINGKSSIKQLAKDIFNVEGMGFTEYIELAAKNAQSMSELVDNIGLGDTEFGEAVHYFSDGVNGFNGAIQSLANGDIFGAINGIVEGFQGFGHMLGIGGGNAEEIQRITERLTHSNELLADRISDLTDRIGDSAGLKAISAYEAALEAQKELQKNNMEILRAQMAYSSAHHSNEYYADDKQVQKLYNESRRTLAKAGYDLGTITGMSDIYNLTPEQLKAIKDFAPDLWRYLTEVGKYDKSEYWESVVEQAGEVEKLTEQINNNLTQTSFDGMRDSFLDTLTDMESSSEDFAQGLEDLMFKAVINSTVLNDEFDEWLKGWQERYAEAVRNNNASELENLREEAASEREKLLAERDAAAEAMKYDGKSSSQSATANSIQQITYEQADSLIGIGLNHTMILEQSLNEFMSQTVMLSSINTQMQTFNFDVKSIRDGIIESLDIQRNMNSHLLAIRENTEPIKAMAENISDIRRDLRSIKDSY